MNAAGQDSSSGRGRKRSVEELEENDAGVQGGEDGDGDDISVTLNYAKEDEAEETLSEHEGEKGDATNADEMLEPSYKNANSIPFRIVCQKLEKVYQTKFGKDRKKRQKTKGLTLKDYLMVLMPAKLIHDLFIQPKRESTDNEPAPESIFPLMRLLCPDKDGSRRTMCKEAALANLYISAFGWDSNRKEAQMLKSFTDSHIIGGMGAALAGDFSNVLEYVLNGGSGESLDENNLNPRVSNQPSKVTVGVINRAIDELAGFNDRFKRASNHDWDRNATVASLQTKKNKAKPPKLSEMKAAWMRRFLNGGDRLISPLEHKWLARILTQNMKIGIGFDKLLVWYHPMGPDLYSGHNSLRHVCKALCQPEMQARRQKDSSPDLSRLTWPPYMPPTSGTVALGHPFTPMFSQKTGFKRILDDMSKRHRNFKKVPDYGQLDKKNSHKHRKAAQALAVNHPVFAIETKLDGERMIIHYEHKSQTVKIHSRNSVWYSDDYSPVLGPAIRKAVGRWDVDLILDGEILAWDSGKQETIPFGHNRTVARLRRDYLRTQGKLDPRDRDLHEGEDEVRVWKPSMIWFGADVPIVDLAGKECWLQFCAFDVLYIGGGPKAKELLHSTISPFLRDAVQPGPLLELDGLERKKLLYRIIEPIPNTVEIVATTVVRPNGEAADGEDYFSYTKPLMELGYPCHLLDSITAAFHGYVPNLSDLDYKRKGGLSDNEISQARATVVQDRYTTIVERLFLEGLMFKDLSSPYVLDKYSRSLSYWVKFKPDYFNGSVASDLDLVIVGAYFATGMRHSGQPSAFLCACLNSSNESQYYPVVKVNGGSIKNEELSKLLQATGFKAATKDESMEEGNWFRTENDDVPDFIAPEIGQEDLCWKPAKKDRPDMWINPSDCCIVLTLNAGEITIGPSFPLGLTLRFPRITRVRYDKKADHTETSDGLWEIYNRVDAERQGKSANGSQVQTNEGGPMFVRFFTEAQYAQSQKSVQKRKRTEAPSVTIAPKAEKLLSHALGGLTFVVLDGVFSLDEMDKEEALAEGWLESVANMKSALAIEMFLRRHGAELSIAANPGTIVLGGQKNDAKVAGHVRGIEYARSRPPPKSKNPTETSLKYQAMARCKGVLRWTFPFQMLSRWDSAYSGTEIERRTKTIKDEMPALVTPNALDYLARPATIGSDVLHDLESLDNVFMMRRALELIESTCSDDSAESANDYFESDQVYRDKLDPEDWWVLSPPIKGSLWPTVDDTPTESTAKEVVVYAHVETNQESLLLEEESIKSVLPLLRVYGASIVPQLTDRVTHIVGNLSPGTDIVEYTRQNSINLEPSVLFCDSNKGQKLFDDLDTAFLLEDPARPVWIVSPAWMRKRCEARWEA